MIIQYDKNPALSIDQKMQSLIESIQLALNEASNVLGSFPVGSYFMTSDTWFNPNNDIGGTWELLDEGYVLLSGSRSGTYRAGREYGENTHTLTEAEMPSHTHTSSAQGYGIEYIDGARGNTYGVWYGTGNHGTGATGGGQPHNIMQKSKAVYIWHRTA